MIIGRYYADGSPLEEVNLQDKGRLFELEVCIIIHPRRYPEYNVDYCSLAFCETKESAEEIMKEFLQEGEDRKKISIAFIYTSECWALDSAEVNIWLVGFIMKKVMR